MVTEMKSNRWMEDETKNNQKVQKVKKEIIEGR